MEKPDPDTPQQRRRQSPDELRRRRDDLPRTMGQAKVLVIDGDGKSLARMTAALAKSGHIVISAADGPAGLRLFFDSRPELVLFDLATPKLDGWALLARIRELSDVPTVALRGGGPLGALVSGYFADIYSAPTVMIVNGALLSLITLGVVLSGKASSLKTI